VSAMGKTMTYSCSWPGCEAKTNNRLLDDWRWGDLHNGFVEHLVEGLPEEGFLCLHHKETVEALEDDDAERFKLLSSI
jgi:hypothetical protein